VSSRRRTGQVAAAIAAVGSFVWAAWAAREASVPEIRMYDGYWMFLGATIGMIVVAPLVWRWPRERSLVAVILATIVGSAVPLAISGIRHHMPVVARLRGSWALGGADLVAPALVIGYVCLWLVLREYGVEDSRRKRNSPP
jgi:hypothetical protein